MPQPNWSLPLIARLSIVGFLVATPLIAPPVRAQASTPPEHRMDMIYAFDGKMPRFSFSIDALRFDALALGLLRLFRQDKLHALRFLLGLKLLLNRSS
mgnify:CR=1 FL=1